MSEEARPEAVRLYFESCNVAVLDFRRDQGISTPLNLIPGAGAFSRK